MSPASCNAKMVRFPVAELLTGGACNILKGKSQEKRPLEISEQMREYFLRPKPLRYEFYNRYNAYELDLNS